jgi:hypothetical protein
MNASPPPSSPSSSGIISHSTREGVAIRQYDSDSDKPASSIKLDEKRSLRRLSSESTTSLLLTPRELEAQPEPIAAPPEDLIPRRTKIIFVTLYFFLNLTLTLSNKSVLSHVSALLFAIRPGSVQASVEGTSFSSHGILLTILQLSLPWLLTTSHTTATSIGCFILMGTGHLTLTPLNLRSHLTLLAFSLLFTLNIAISNVSLAMVSVPFHQVMRSTCPVVTILIYRTIFARTYSYATYFSIIPLVLGAGLATAGDYQASLLGVLLTLLGVLLACIKTIATNRLMTGPLSLSAVELLLRLSPLAAIQCMAYAYLTGELHTLRHFQQLEGGFSSSFTIAILANACMAFALNIVSFQTNKMVGALAVTVCGNVKQAMTIAVGIVLFSVPVGLLNAVGMGVTVLGAAWFSKVELDGKKARMVAGT